MPKRQDLELLRDIAEAVRRIENYLKGISYQKFSQDTKTQDAVVRNLEIIGEAVKNISTEFKKKHQQVEWAAIARMRDRLIHHYFGVNFEIVWDVVKEKLPELKLQIQAILNRG